MIERKNRYPGKRGACQRVQDHVRKQIVKQTRRRRGRTYFFRGADHGGSGPAMPVSIVSTTNLCFPRVAIGEKRAPEAA